MVRVGLETSMNTLEVEECDVRGRYESAFVYKVITFTGRRDYFAGVNELVRAFYILLDVVVVLLCIASFMLCARALWRTQQLRNVQLFTSGTYQENTCRV